MCCFCRGRGGSGPQSPAPPYAPGTERFRIHEYKDLNPLLGKDWHWRGFNRNGDYCYVVLDTVEYYLYRRQPLKEYVPAEAGPLLQLLQLGYMLVFQFVPQVILKDTSIFQ